MVDLSSVHTSNNVEATLSNATGRTIFSTKSNVASTKLNVASALLLVWMGLKTMFTRCNCWCNRPAQSVGDSCTV